MSIEFETILLGEQNTPIEPHGLFLVVSRFIVVFRFRSV